MIQKKSAAGETLCTPSRESRSPGRLQGNRDGMDPAACMRAAAITCYGVPAPSEFVHARQAVDAALALAKLICGPKGDRYQDILRRASAIHALTEAKQR
jgi:hypothetical protein